jgi:hypothetical protein
MKVLMGVEIFLLVLLAAAAVAAFLFFTGAFGAAAAPPGSKRESKPKHVYPEDDAKAQVTGGEVTTSRLREEAENDPETEVR